jgi:large subunit ribosomal protein L1
MGKTKTAFVSEGTEDKKKEHKKAHVKEEKIHISGLKGGQRVKEIEATPIETEGAETEKEKAQRVKRIRVRGKKWIEVKAKVDRSKEYKIKDAVALAKATSFSTFDGSMEAHLILKKVGTSVNTTLPHAAGKEKKIEIAGEETIKKLQTGKIDFDVLIASPDMMPKLVPFARILGPKGLMPNPKNGTLVADPKKAKGFSGNSITLKTEKEAPLIHTVFGKVSQKDVELVENLEAILKALGSARQIVKGYIKATMGPSVKIQI